MATTADLPFQLDPDERLIWSGPPRTGILFRAADFTQVSISLVILYVFVSRLRSASISGPIEASIWGVLFLAILYVVVGRFIFDAVLLPTRNRPLGLHHDSGCKARVRSARGSAPGAPGADDPITVREPQEVMRAARGCGQPRRGFQR